MKSLKERLKSGEVTVGSWITLGHTAIAEMMATSGFDWLVVDMEHSVITLDLAQELIRVIQLCGVTSLVRVGENDPNLIKRVMDAGAGGVIVPMVNTKKDVIDAVNAVKYPPVGTRGVGLARAQGYGLRFDAYKKWVNKESVVIVQIEHIDAVRNLDDILGTDGVDAFIVGPYDLSASLGKPGDFESSDFTGALGTIKDLSVKHSAVPGFHVIPPDARMAAKKIREGYRFIGFSLDTMFLGVKCGKELGDLRRVIAK